MSSKRKSNKSKGNVSSTKENKTIVKCKKHVFEDDDIPTLQQSLLSWYDKEQRTLPWRTIAKTEKDDNVRGYAVWVSEVMLQQTQVATVIPYFNKWIKKWPTVQALSESTLDEVLKEWAGLGYYSRGRRLHEGAQHIVKKLGGNIPQTVPDLMRSIPGVGAYSASAIASVAFNRSVGVVDGNVIRVLARMRVIGVPVTVSGVREHLWSLANKIVSDTRPGDFNQALMELGATVCTPQTPNCANCPVNLYCKAYAASKRASKLQTLDSCSKRKNQHPCKHIKGSSVDIISDIEDGISCDMCLPESVWKEKPHVTAYPCKAEKKSARQEKISVLILQKEDKYLMFKRPEKGLLAGLWEFPSIPLSENEATESTNSKWEGLLKDYSVTSSLLASKKRVREVVHLFSHIHTTYVVDHLVLKKSTKKSLTTDKSTWMAGGDLKTAAVSTAMKKVFRLVCDQSDSAPKQVCWRDYGNFPASLSRRTKTPNRPTPNGRGF